MKLMMFETGGTARLGVVEGDSVADVSASGLAGGPGDLLSVIEGGRDALSKVAAAAKTAPKLALKDVTAAMPIAKPPKFICVGLNYALHAREGGHEIPTYPSFFLRVTTSLLAADAPVIRPKCSDQLDYECELAIVIGKGGRHIPEDKALDHVFGYTIFNDVSVRNFQRKSSQWTSGKNFDGTGPVGPAVVTADDLPPGASGLRITTRVNGNTMQDSNTDDMIFSTERIIALLSEFMTLEPGDIIATGTPSGVAHARKPPAWMKAGDVVEIEIDGIGILRNPIVDEV
ncbi:MAG TPA: fumarylacetoacetate hydrolase family protein [Hyphomicrobiaceae bacterium]|nr:fumarylacetoacetate hydrolase family protein [Hyphomicrobiaceae bacterium]